MRLLPCLALVAAGLLGTAAVAQEHKTDGCAQPAEVAEAATPPQPGDGTAPGNASTGWSGGLGGSHTGTNPQGAVPESVTDHPETARGLDLAGAPEALRRLLTALQAVSIRSPWVTSTRIASRRPGSSPARSAAMILRCISPAWRRRTRS